VDLAIRPIEPDEFATFVRSVERAFGEHLEPAEVENERLVFEADRSLPVLDGERIVGTAGAFSLTLTVPGARVPMAGVTVVGVSPTHRRRGLLTQMMRRQLDDVRERGESIAGLWASESSIYGRFGYGMAALSTRLEIETARSAFARPAEPGGAVEIVEKDEALVRMPPIHERVVPTRPGMWSWHEGFWRHDTADHERWRDGFGALFFALHRTGGQDDGYVVYRLKSDWENGLAGGTLRISELMSESAGAYADLWRYCLGVDLIDKLDAWPRPLDEPLRYMLAEPRRLKTLVGDSLWIRVVDVPAALAARRYSQSGSVVFEVRDAFCPWTEGRYLLEGGPDGATCAPTGREPDLAVSAEDLGAAYLGGVRFSVLQRAGRVDGEPNAIRRADAMFAWDPLPWCPTVF
jgi:predicted acetyltransferase